MKDGEKEVKKNAGGVCLALDTTEGEWFQFFASTVNSETGDVVYEDPAPDARAKIRSAAPAIETMLKKRKRITEHVFNPKTRSMERVSGFEPQTAEQMMSDADEAFDYAVMELEGFKDSRTGAVIECTRENKLALRHNQVFNRFYERCQQILNGTIKAQEKN